jgi:hypothetical protein
MIIGKLRIRLSDRYSRAKEGRETEESGKYRPLKQRWSEIDASEIHLQPADGKTLGFK